jgi:hypothetical protein
VAWRRAAWRGELSQGKELLKRNSANAVNIISAWLGKAGLGAASCRSARQGLFDKRNTANAVNIIAERLGMAGRGEARRGEARLGELSQGKELLMGHLT